MLTMAADAFRTQKRVLRLSEITQEQRRSRSRMERHFKRVFSLLLTLLTMVPLLCFSASAASGRISFDDPSVTVGETVTVTMSVTSDTDIAAFTATLTYDESLLEFVSGSGDGTVKGGAGSLQLSFFAGQTPDSSVGYSLKFKAKAAGTAVVQPTAGEFADMDEQTVTPDFGHSKVTIRPLRQVSSEARLSSLKVGAGSLAPTFDPDIYDYSLSVPADTEELSLSVSTKDRNAKYSISGTKLSVGENITTVTVTAEDGGAAIYTIFTTRPEREKQEEEPEEKYASSPAQLPAEEARVAVTVDGSTLYVAEDLEGIEIPEGFEVQMIQYGQSEVPAAVGIVKPLTLLWLVDEAGNNGAFYVQDASGGGFYPYVSLTTGQKAVTVLPLGEEVMIPAGYEESSVTIGEERFTCWKSAQEPDSEFVLLYGMNWDGRVGFYRYDTVEGTIQRWSEESSMLSEQHNGGDMEDESSEMLAASQAALQHSRLLVAILLAAAAAELVILLLFVLKGQRSLGARERCNEYTGARSGASRGSEADPRGDLLDCWNKDDQ